jgi:hypothetical protein
MQFASKFMLVPFVKPIEDPEQSYLSSLDQEMTAILNSKLKQDEKITLYGKALSKFISINNP